MSCDRSCFDKTHSNFEYEDCYTCNGRDDGKLHLHQSKKSARKINANELADFLQNKAESELNPRLQEAATMLRQQQAEIDALKKKIISLEFLARKEK